MLEAGESACLRHPPEVFKFRVTCQGLAQHSQSSVSDTAVVEAMDSIQNVRLSEDMQYKLWKEEGGGKRGLGGGKTKVDAWVSEKGGGCSGKRKWQEKEITEKRALGRRGHTY